MSELQRQREQAQEQLPERAIEIEESPEEGEGESVLQRFEVAVAYNLDYPYRYSQDFFWIEVLAGDEREAALIAQGWVLSSEDERWELTRLVRECTEHHSGLGAGPHGEPLPVIWNLPIDRGLRPGTIVRDPITSLRVGFIAHPEDERRWVPREHQRGFQLITRKPVRGADPVCLAPLVENLSPLHYGG